MSINSIVEELKKNIASFEKQVNVEETGTVTEVGDGIARLRGLSQCQASEMLEFPGGTFGVALNLEEEAVGTILLGEYKHIKEGDTVKRTGRILSVPVGEELIGRVVNPLGQVIDGGAEIKTKQFYPIGRGQREHIIGDRQTGNTAIAIDTIINQKGHDMVCVYVAIGQKESKVARIVAKLQETGAMEYTTVVVAGASDPAPTSFIAPPSGVAIAEY